MQNLLHNLEKLLSGVPEFVTDGKLVKNKVVEKALALDPTLLKLLLSDKSIKEQFFQDVGGTLVFDKVKFQQFVSNKTFLPDSYTAFKNQIGLTNEKGEFLKKSKDVVLTWAYKDCVLEGGQDKEDAKRDEIFYNEILAPDEITRLYDEKVIHKFEKWDLEAVKKGKAKEVKDFNRDENGTIKDNLLIKGNNLLALHSLKKEFAGKVKLIYIDPPYNTATDANTFKYNNTFNHSTWLTFMKNRLEIAKELLREDGILAITIDDFEQAYLKITCDEVLGRDNYIGTVIIQNNPRGRTINSYFATCHEYCHFYGKNIKLSQIGDFDLTDEQSSAFNLKDELGAYRLLPFRRSGGYSTPEERPNSYYPIYYREQSNQFYLEKKENTVEIFPVDIDGKKRVWRQTKPSFLEAVKKGDIVCKKYKDKYSILMKDRVKDGRKPKTIWVDSKYDASSHGTILLKKIFNDEKLFSYPKSIHAVIDTLKITTNTHSNDIILDFFAGSGTTAHAVMELNKQDGGNRKFILTEQMDYIRKLPEARIKKIIEAENISESFIYCELMEWNERYIKPIKEAKTTKELFAIYEQMKKNAVFHYDYDKEKHKNLDLNKLSIDEQKAILMDLLNKNHLYVLQTEIDDPTYGVSEEDKKLNKDFFKKLYAEWDND